MSTTYPLHVEAELDPQLNRWLWLVKWLLAIPHYVVLVFLWLAFMVLSVVAFFAILFTGRYPRAIFDFNVGVLRWTWRVGYYAYNALGTDRYPPFTLEDVPDYPARLTVEYPQHLSRGLVLVKWWLLAIPQYLVVALIAGGGVYAGSRVSEDGVEPIIWSNGLVGLLVLVAAVILLVTGKYPRPLFDLVLGLNRWVLRVAAYAALMTDQYPPFRLDQGGHEPDDGGRLDVASGPPPTQPPTQVTAQFSDQSTAQPTSQPTSQPTDPPPGQAPGQGWAQPSPPPPSPPQDGPAPRRWGAGRVIALVAGCLIALWSLGLGVGGVTLLVIDQAGRDADGFLMSDEVDLESARYAVVSDDAEFEIDPAWQWVPNDVLGRVRLSAVSDNGQPVFVGVGPVEDVRAYLDGVAYDELVSIDGFDRDTTYRPHTGGEPGTAPADSDVWIAASAGPGRQNVDWELTDGTWVAVVMNADGSAGVDAEVSVGATAPALTAVAVVLLVLAVGGLLVAALIITLTLREPRRVS